MSLSSPAIPFVFERHYTAVADLWRRVFAARYPVSDRVLAMRLGYRHRWQPGDEWVILHGDRAVAFGQVDIERHGDGTVSPTGQINVLMVDPGMQRRGLGSAVLTVLADRLREAGCTTRQVGGFLNRFWSGVPEDQADALAFFRQHGYVLDHPVYDLIVDLAQVGDDPPLNDDQTRAGITLSAATADDLGALLDFQRCEFAGWVSSLVCMVNAGDLGNVLVIKDQGVIRGSIQTMPPSARWRGPNLVWESIFGPGIGGYGAVGIANAWRGRGLGLALCRGATRHLRRLGATQILIDWTGLLDFYARVGARPWKRFYRGQWVAPASTASTR